MNIKYDTLISVLITSYNREKFIAEAIESVLVQSFKNLEIIISDDASTDKSFTIAQLFEKKDSRIKAYRNNENRGQFQNRNLAASYAKGDILMYVDSDDTIRPDTLSYIAEVFQQFPKAGFATIYKDNSFAKPFTMNSRAVLKKHFFEQSVMHIGPGGTAITKDLFNKIGGFPQQYGPVGDMFYNIKAAAIADEVILMPYDYLNYRRHEGQEINQVFSYLYHGYTYFNDIMKLEELPLTVGERSFLLKKNKRRFLVNTTKFLVKEKDLPKFITAIRLANYTFKDFIQAIFHQ